MGTERVRILYRSKKVSVPLLAAISEIDGWAQHGVVIDRLDRAHRTPEADAALLAGEVDFVFGSHLTPYAHRARGAPVTYLGQSTSWCTDALITRAPVGGLEALRGATFAEKRCEPGSHPWGNHRLYLERAGIAPGEVTFVAAEPRRPVDLVASGEADAAIVPPPQDVLAEELGLAVRALEWLPMVHGTTLTTTVAVRDGRPDLCRAVVSAVRAGIDRLRAADSRLSPETAAAVGATTPRAASHLAAVLRGSLSPDLRPTSDAIRNAHRLAVELDPVAAAIDPHSLWDLRFL